MASRDFVGGGSSLGDVNSYSGTSIPKWLQEVLGINVSTVDVSQPNQKIAIFHSPYPAFPERADYAEVCRKYHFWKETLPIWMREGREKD